MKSIKYRSFINLLLVILLISAFTISCGKKTDPISKDTLERAGLPKLFTVNATADGVLVSNNEDAYLLVEKAAVKDEDCSEYKSIVIIAPKEQYLDKDVTPLQKYSYRFTKKTIKYGIVSDSVIKQVTYSAPPNVLSAEYKDGVIEIVPSKEFLRMDIYANGKSIVQTGRNFAEAPAENLSIVLTDKYGNAGSAYKINLKQTTKTVTVHSVAGLDAVKFDNDLRIFWNTSDAENYLVEICDGSSCEKTETTLPYEVYQKEFDNCLDITVYATSGKFISAPAVLHFCK